MLTEEQIKAIAAKHVSICSDDVKCALAEDVENAIREALAAHSAGEQEPDCWAIMTPNGSRLVSPEEAKGRKSAYPLYAQPPMTDAARDAKRFAFLITNIKRYQLRESKGRWYYAPVTSQDWQYGYASAREAIDAEIERGEKS